MRILHLEDDARDAEMVRNRLEVEGLPCDIVLVDDRNGFESALTREPFDLIISDFTLPLYDGGFRYAALRDADSQLRLAKTQTRGQVARIEDELRQGQIALDSSKALRDEAEQEVAASRENNQLINAQFAAGTATQVEVSDAQTALFQSEATLLQQQLAVQLAALRLAKAVGAFDPQSQ